MVEFKKITMDMVREVIKMDPGEEGKNYVAPNVTSLAQAYVVLANKTGDVMPFAIYHEDQMVGFIQMSYATPDQDEDLDEPMYDIWRFMVDEKFQGKGYGKAALKKAIDYIRTYPCGPANKLSLSYVPGNAGASGLYKSVGFEETGDMDHGEVIMELDLRK